MASKVEELGDDKASLFLVDPNPPGGDIVPPEDLFMYVSLRAIRRQRSVLETDGGTKITQNKIDGEINFIATEVINGADGKTPVNGGETYATTSWTDIGGARSNSSGNLEGFGIESINITYGASLVPQAEMVFTDLRGSSLFDVIDADGRQTPYSVFFDMPYPIFELTVKGYFGKAVSYCFHMTKWNSEFDGSTGNFKIKASFVGFQQAFLADMVLGNILGAVNTKEGQTALSKIKIKNADGTEDDTPKLDDFINEISKIPLKVDNIKDNSDSYKVLQKLNKKLAKLRQLRSFIGEPINVSSDDNKKSSSTQINSSRLPRASFQDKDYIVLRDIIVIKESVEEKFLLYATEAVKILDEYKEISFKIDNGNSAEFQNFLFSREEESQEIKIGAESISKAPFSGVWSSITQSGTTSFHERWKEDNFDYSRFDNTRQNYVGENKFIGDDTVKVVAYDFFLMRKEINDTFKTLRDDRDAKETSVREELNEKLKRDLGFNPTIKDVVSIIMNNTQAMLLSLYEVSKQAETKGKERAKILKAKKIDTDTPPNVQSSDDPIIYAWPEIFQPENTSGRNHITRKWLGETLQDDPEAKSSFPEIQFIEDVVDSYLTANEKIKQTKDTVSKVLSQNKRDGFYSFLPGDIENRYSCLNFGTCWVRQNGKSIPIDLVKILVDSPFLLEMSSTPTDIVNKFSKLEPVHMCETIVNDIHRNVLNENLDVNDIIETAINENFIVESNGNLSSRDIGVFPTDHPNEETYIILPNDNNFSKIIANTEEVSKKIRNDVTHKGYIDEIQKNYKQSPPTKEEGIKNFDNTYKLPTHDLSYLVWGNIFRDKILNGKDPKSTFNFKIDDLSKIGADDYVGLIKKGDANTPLIGSKTWTANTKENRALLLLNTLPFDNPGNPENDIIKMLSDRGKIVKFPKYYVLWLCGTIWRKLLDDNNNFQPIVWVNEELGTRPSLIENFIYWTGSTNGDVVKRVYDISEKEKAKVNSKIPKELINLNKKTKLGMMDFFLKWVDSSEFDSFTTLVSSFLNEKETSKSGNNAESKTPNTDKLLNELSKTTKFISVSPKIWRNDGEYDALSGSTLGREKVETYISNFISHYRGQKICKVKLNAEQGKKEKDEETKEEVLSNKDLKIVMYGYFKNIYDKWIGGTEDGKSFNICGANIHDRDLIDYFKFINRAWCDIGEEAVINLDSVKTLSSNFKSNVYFFLGKILRDSNFLLQILPSFINFKNAKDIEDIFNPITTIDSVNSSPIYVCIQAGGNSKSLKLPKSGPNTHYRDDTLVLKSGQAEQLPQEFLGCSKPTDSVGGNTYGLVAFRVAFGAQNQTIFKNVSLNQEEHRETGEYHKALADLIDKRGGTQRVSQGMDLYPIFQTRSYTCKVDGLGCMNIQPLMYFQLDNVPFFNGAYLITNVQHSITANHITTNFSGVRQSSITVPIITDVTTFLNIPVNEDIDNSDTEDTPPVRTSVNFGVDFEKQAEQFEMNSIVTRKNQSNGAEERGNLDLLGITTDDKNGESVNILFRDEDFDTDSDDDLSGTDTPFGQILSNYTITSNAQVITFLSMMIAESSGFKHREEILTITNATDAEKLYKRRGYLLVGGKELYEEANKDETLKGIISPFLGTDEFDLITKPEQVAISQEASLAFACWYWAKHKVTDNKILNDVTKKDGSGATYLNISDEINNKGSNFNVKVDSFEKVLTAFNLKDTGNIVSPK